MRNKRVKYSVKVDSKKVSTPLKRSLKIKNREQLRRKLKDLLEKDKSLTPDKTKPKVVSDVVKNVYKNANIAKKQEDTHIQKSNGVKKKKEKRALTNAVLKRKQIEKPVAADKNNKVFKMSSPQDPPPNIPAKKGKKKKSVQKHAGKEKTEYQVNKENTFNKAERKVPQVRPKAKSNQPSTSKPVEKENLPKLKKQARQIKESTKQSECKYKGPLRPVSPESGEDDEDDTPPSQSSEMVKKSGWFTESESESPVFSDGSIVEQFNGHSSDSSESEMFSASDASIEEEDFMSSEFDCSSTDSLYDYESDGFEDFSAGDTDSTYKLPKNMPEDIYVAKGAAIKHDLSESNEIPFDSDDSCAQIIEISNKKQEFHNALTWKDDSNEKKNTESTEKGYESADSCPELVPIDDDIYTESDDSDDSDCSDCSGCSSDCLMHKYVDIDRHENINQKVKMVPGIFQADKNASCDFDNSMFNTSATVSKREVQGSPLERIANGNATKANYNIITVNNKKRLVFADENVKTNGIGNTNATDTDLRKLSNHDNSNQSKGFAEKTMSLDRIESESNLKQKCQNFQVAPSESHDAFKRKNVEHAANDNLLRSVGYQKESAATNNKTELKTLFFNAANSNQVIVLLKDPLYLYGTLKVKLLAGGLNIFGYNPKHNEILEVFSPRGYGSLKLEPSAKISSQPVDENELNALAKTFLKADIENVRKNYDCKQDAIIILERNDNSKKVKMLKKYMIEDLFPNMNLLQSDRPYYTSEFLLRCVLTSTADKALTIYPIWRSIPVNNASRIMVIGGKSVGKSTLVRFLSNVYLNKGSKVLLIDLDIGQPEMFVPQTVSATTITAPLLGPGYLSVKDPDKAFLVGQINVVLQPQRYIQSVHALISFCKENADYKDIPWIVNTMGYNKGFGDEIIAAICRFLNPTNIVQLESENEINNFDIIMSKENLRSMPFDIIGDLFCSNADYHPDHVLTLLSSVASSYRKYVNDCELKPRDMRLANVIARLSAALMGQAEWLTDIKPVCASTDDLKFINLGDEDLNLEDLLKGLVGNLVYMCKQNSNSSNECLGIGIVRGIDFPLKQIYLLPAMPMKLLKEVNCLAICGIPLPSAILINQGPKVKGVVSYVYNTINRSSSMHIKQIYHRPQHFLTGKFKSVID